MRPTTKVILNGKVLDRNTKSNTLNLTELKIWNLLRAGAYPTYIRTNLEELGFKGKVKIFPSKHIAFDSIKKDYPEWF